MYASGILSTELHQLQGDHGVNYSLEELVELVPHNIFTDEAYYRLFISAENGRWRAEYGGSKHHKFTTQTGSLADTLCKLAIRLKRAGLL